jgi:hypothetical protein
MTKPVLVKVSVFKGTVASVYMLKGEQVWSDPFVATPQEWARALNEYPQTRDEYPQTLAVKKEPLKQCPRPQRHGQDEYHCTVCNVIWGVDEPRPACDT